MKNLIVYVDAGHGGLHPTTQKHMTFPEDGKQYTFLGKGAIKPLTVLEGVINRKIAGYFMELLKEADIPFRQIHHDYLDTRNIARCSKANGFAFQDLQNGLKPIYMSFHSNAFGMSAEGKGEQPRGWSVWTTRGRTESDTIAEIWYNETKKLIGDKIVYRQDLSDGDNDFEENFTVLFGTDMPAVLVENLFYTNREDAKLLLSEEYQKLSAKCALNTVLTYKSL